MELLIDYGFKAISRDIVKIRNGILTKFNLLESINTYTSGPELSKVQVTTRDI